MVDWIYFRDFIFQAIFSRKSKESRNVVECLVPVINKVDVASSSSKKNAHLYHSLIPDVSRVMNAHLAGITILRE